MKEGTPDFARAHEKWLEPKEGPEVCSICDCRGHLDPLQDCHCQCHATEEDWADYYEEQRTDAVRERDWK